MPERRDPAIGLQSSMEHVLNERLSRKEIHVAVGLEWGRRWSVASARRDSREVICLGREVTSAERLQLCSKGDEIRISGSCVRRPGGRNS